MKFNAKKLFINPYTISFIILVVILAGLYVGTFNWLDSYTKHGIELVVPDVSDLTEAEAAAIFKENKMKCEVVDSIYVKKRKLGVVVEQIPSAGSKVKEGRTIYLITNSNTIRRIVFPDVREISLRQAEATIKSVGLKVDSIVYVPSEYKDLVLDAQYNGKVLPPGFRIPEGASVVLHVGRGDTNEGLPAPSFRGLTVTQAIDKSHTVFLNIGEVFFDVQPKDDKDKEEYFVYKQTPITGTVINYGTSVSIYLTKNPNLLEEPEEIFGETENGETISIEN